MKQIIMAAVVLAAVGCGSQGMQGARPQAEPSPAAVPAAAEATWVWQDQAREACGTSLNEGYPTLCLYGRVSKDKPAVKLCKRFAGIQNVATVELCRLGIDFRQCLSVATMQPGSECTPWVEIPAELYPPAPTSGTIIANVASSPTGVCPPEEYRCHYQSGALPFSSGGFPNGPGR